MREGVSLSLSEKCFSEFVNLIYQLTGITIGSNRISLVEGRLRRRVLSLHYQSYEEYLEYVCTHKNEQVEFINLMTTNETYFFRTPRVWDYIEKIFLPQWILQHPDKKLTAWSAAASSGEEAHSLGVICQSFRDQNQKFNYQILGTDISTEMIELCQKGEYSGRSIEAFKKTRPEQFLKYMKSISNAQFQAHSDIRSRLKFQTHNLFSPLSSNEVFDLILIRNVLIYFKTSDQEKVLEVIQPKLAHDGLLVIGESESLSYIKSSFKSIEPLLYCHKQAEEMGSKAG